MLKETCKNCFYYTAYYEKFSSCYGKLNHGYCRKQSKQNKQNETCEEYCSNAKKEKGREKMMFKQLEQALISINEIAMIMKEKEAEKKK